MINLRYHIVSITAVFLALGIGIAMGSSFLGAAAVDRVDENIRDVRQEAAEARAERDVLQDQVDADEELQAQMLEEGPATVFTNDLPEVPVVLITVGGVDDDGLDAVRVALESSEAQFEGVLRVDDKIVDEGAAEELGAVLGVPGTEGAELQDELVAAVAGELSEHGVVPGEEPAGETPTTEPGTTEPGTTAPVPTEPGATTVPGTTAPVPTEPGATTPPGATTVPEDPGSVDPAVPEPTALRDLVAAGFLAWEPAAGGPEAPDLLAGEGYRYVVVTGSEPEVPDSALLLPVLEAMAADGPAPVVVGSAASGEDPAEREATRLGPLTALREDDVLRDRISTVDDLEVFAGTAAVMGAVDDLAGTDRGHYGLGEGRDSLLPPPG
ncbi:copper transporter [Iamia majanohamensis]|uniref:Copper transporter n=1 Tax=Iamia majanohamensis TaxID=467976 RepID=A0AAE9YF59_9ACTN|nr:copper transporter [Iamia majanohamensis]WCO67442.1 copper transporter [Iamia majanohamensis]